LAVKRNLATGLILLFLWLPCQALSVYEVPKSEADLIVYVTKDVSEADAVVYVASSPSEARGRKWVWYFCEDRSEADKLVAYTRERSEATLVIYLTDDQDQAGKVK
jgi:hypothetical protein